jgi:hypothetical protein
MTPRLIYGVHYSLHHKLDVLFNLITSLHPVRKTRYYGGDDIIKSRQFIIEGKVNTPSFLTGFTLILHVKKAIA